MASWGMNASVVIRNGKLERKCLNRHFSSRREESFIERSNRGGIFVPGVALSINFERYTYLHFGHGFNSWRQDRLCHPEMIVMRTINDITDLENWQLNVDEFSVCQSWKSEIFENHHPRNDQLWEWCLCELRKKAAAFKKTEQRGVFVLDAASRVYKSDRLMGTDLFTNLKEDTEDMFPELQRYTEDNKPLDLSPWMFPYQFCLSPFRTDGKHITLDNSLDSMTVGEVPIAKRWDADRLNNGEPLFYSSKSQWLATDVKFSQHDSGVSIISPINNLHPVRHKSIYTAVEHLVSDVIDDWNQTLLYKALARGVSRIKPRLERCVACSRSKFDACSCRVDFRDSVAWAEGRQSNAAPDEKLEARWNPILALDGFYSSSKRIYDKISLRDGFQDRGLQIYVETITIHVDADGTITEESQKRLNWDLNGNRNERIVASTVLCLRRHNIQKGSGGMSFRSETKLNTWEDPPKCEKSKERVAAGPSSTSTAGPSSASAAGPSSTSAAGPSSASASATGPPNSHVTERMPVFQELGTVQLPEGRMISYPNVLQHKFELPQLENSKKAGSIQFMQIHLADPHYILTSTRYVPLQNEVWWEEVIEFKKMQSRTRLPDELARLVIDNLLIPESLPPSMETFRHFRHYWLPQQKLHKAVEGRNQPCQPPVRMETALRRAQDARKKHEAVMRAVNGPKLYGRAAAITVWMQTMLRDRIPLDLSDPCDHRSILLPETEENDAGSSGAGAAANAINIEEENLRDWESELEFEEPSSEVSIDGDYDLRVTKKVEEGKGKAVDDGGDAANGGDATDGRNAAAGGSTTSGGNAPDGGAETEIGEEQFFDAQYAFTLAELAEIEQGLPQPVDAEELGSLYDDAMSQLDYMEVDDLEDDDLEDDEFVVERSETV